jgi:hypothetical protein
MRPVDSVTHTALPDVGPSTGNPSPVAEIPESSGTSPRETSSTGRTVLYGKFEQLKKQLYASALAAAQHDDVQAMGNVLRNPLGKDLFAESSTFSVQTLLDTAVPVITQRPLRIAPGTANPNTLH